MELSYKEIEDYIFNDIRQKLFDVVEGKEEECGSDFLYPHHIKTILEEKYDLANEERDSNGWEPDMWSYISLFKKGSVHTSENFVNKICISWSGTYGNLTVSAEEYE